MQHLTVRRWMLDVSDLSNYITNGAMKSRASRRVNGIFVGAAHVVGCVSSMQTILELAAVLI